MAGGEDTTKGSIGVDDAGHEFCLHDLRPLSVGGCNDCVSCSCSELPLPASTDDGNEGYQTGSGPQDTTEQT
jgi:hypothetical protein